jgi:carbamoyl-phosphate synthase large subunit
VLKSRQGSGAKNVFIVDRSDQLGAYSTLFPDWIWQEHVGIESEEFTCGVFRSSTGSVRTIVFRRRLENGRTVYAVPVDNNIISNFCELLSQKLDLRGSINVQLRVVDGTPMVFEINPRFSSTVRFRHLLGFKDVMWSIEDRVSGIVSEYHPNYTVETKCYRDFVEKIR